MVRPRENRVPIMMSDGELTAIDDWRFANRVATRSEAIRRLVQIGLYADGELDELHDQMRNNLRECTKAATAVQSAIDEGAPIEDQLRLNRVWVKMVSKAAFAMKKGIEHLLGYRDALRAGQKVEEAIAAAKSSRRSSVGLERPIWPDDYAEKSE